MKKVLVLINDHVGLYKFRRELLQEFINRGYKVYISLPDDVFVKYLKEMGCQFIQTAVDRRGINPKTDLKLMLHYYKMIKSKSPDLVITYTIKPNIYGGLICRWLKTAYAVNITGLGTAFQNNGMLKKFVIGLYKVATKKAKAIFFENTDNAQEFLKDGIVKRDRMHILPGAGVNLEDYPFMEYPQNNNTRFLFIGRVMREKGVDELFKAAERIRKEFPETVFDIVGQMEDDYRDIIKDLADQKIIEYHGFQEDVKPFIRQCNCFILPSWHEGMANANLECAASGRPLITSNIHGCKEAVIENKSGFLCESKNADSLYTAIKKFMQLSETERKDMGTVSRRHMENVFDRKIVIEKTIEVLEK